jgi:hypothetical protein
MDNAHTDKPYHSNCTFKPLALSLTLITFKHMTVIYFYVC